MVTEEILSPTTFGTQWASIGYCETSGFFFWLIFLLSSPPSCTYEAFPYSSSMNTSVVESSIFQFHLYQYNLVLPQLEHFFLKGYFFQCNHDFFENKTVNIRQVSICERSLLDFILKILFY